MATDQTKLIASLLNDTVHTLLKEKYFNQTTPVLVPHINIDQPKLDTHGDFSTNIALQLAKSLNSNPQLLAQEIINHTKIHPVYSNLVEKIEVAKPGFINIWVKSSESQKIIHEILAAGSSFGRNNKMQNRSIILEYVSANPTGPLHVGHARQAVLGDTLAKIFSAQGANVWREFYYNDSGNQIKNLTESVIARLNGLRPGDKNWPQDGYAGEYIQEIAALYQNQKSYDFKKKSFLNQLDFKKSVQNFAISYLRYEQDCDLKSIGVKFDGYFLESSLHKNQKVQKIIDKLKASGYTYEQDNALWLQSTKFGDDKDRVMIKSDRTYTYFVPDIAYHVEKWNRGFQAAINIQGSDHHSTTTRVRAGLQALQIGIPKNFPDYILHSMVRVTKNGAEVKISKRSGNYITIRDLVEWSSESSVAHKEQITNLNGKDAIRFFLISRKPDTEFIFDVDLAKKRNEENPVYYVQYAHARICSILFHWGGDKNIFCNTDLSPLKNNNSAKKLIKILAFFPKIIERASKECSPHYIAFYTRDLASSFHSFYNTEHVLVENEKEKLAKLALLTATKQVLLNALNLIGVSAPEKM